MTDSPPPSLLVTPDARRRLAQRYDEAVRLAAGQPCDQARVHELLAECVRTDPGNILYLDALLANLRRWNPKAGRFWLPGWLRPTSASATNDAPAEEVLRDAPKVLRERWPAAGTLRALADAAAACQFDEVELRYRLAAVDAAPGEVETGRELARALACQGRFDEARACWQQILQAPGHGSDAESGRMLAVIECAREQRAGKPQAQIELELNSTRRQLGEEPHELRPYLEHARALAEAACFDEAERVLADARAVGGGSLAVLEAVEALQLARSADRLAIARLLAAEQGATLPRMPELVARLEREHNRLEIDFFHLRSERHPDDLSLRLELARRLKRAGNYSGAIQRLKEACGDARHAAEVLLELGECWQHLRQFDKALEYYRQAVAVAQGGDQRLTLETARRRLNVLAAAMSEPAPIAKERAEDEGSRGEAAGSG
jgi:tetratricopeptide (TPR) repeat protein